MASTAAARREIGYAAARERVLEAAGTLPPERVPLAEAVGRPLHRAIVARHALPPFRNSAMDGIAVRGADLAHASSSSPVSLAVVDVIPAGRVASRPLRPGEAMRIMTGAMVPEGADTIVPVEELEFARDPHGAETVRVRRAPRPGEHVREAGADVAAGETAVPAGRGLTPHDLALLASLGEARVEVGRRPAVEILSTGDELVDVDAPLAPGAIRDSNLPMLAALAEECGARVVAARRVSDDPDLVAARLREALERADVVVTIGGVSAGDFDPVKLAIAGLDSVELWRVAMRPGQPQAFGSPRGRLFFGLPGNPASVACVFEALVRPALRRLQGFASLDRTRIAVRAGADIPSRRGRTDFVRVTLERVGEEWRAIPAGEQVSGHLAPQSRAHGLLVVPEAVERLARGERGEALVLRWPEEARP